MGEVARQDESKYTIIYSELLGQKMAVSNSSGWTYCEDGTIYSSSELEIIKGGCIGVLPIQVHILKKVFKGQIVAIETEKIARVQRRLENEV